MKHESDSRRILPSANVREFFRESVDEALSRQRVRAEDHTVHYVVNLLTLFARAEELYEDRSGLRPLASMLGEAVEAPTETERDRAMQRLGDVALFVAGFFPDYFARRCVDVDYYIRMGGSAYSWLAERSRQSVQVRAFGQVFAELSEKFGQFVEVIGEVSEQGRSYTDADIMRLYELWLRTGSARASRRLRELGVEPTEGASSRLTH
ncbi:MAG: hypothetical protein P8080_05170 [Gammaproteobacteria bacterium]|jgi:hypothetical protein